MTNLAAFLHEQAPFEHHIFTYRQDTLLEHGTDAVRKPVIEFGTPVCVGNQLDSESQLGERNAADIQGFERLCCDKCYDARLWAWPPQF